MNNKETLREYDVVVVGAGPAGMMASLIAGGRGKKVALVEKNSRAGRKLLLTGQGRCNITNEAPAKDFPSHYRNGDFLRNGLHRFSNTDLIGFFESNGLKTKVEPDGRVFPRSDRAEDVVVVLQRLMDAGGVDFFPGLSVAAIDGKDRCFETAADDIRFRSGNVVLACGGRSYPATGSSGDGYAVAAHFGHTVFPPVPALCGIETEEPFIHAWEGIGLKKITVTALSGNTTIAEDSGDMVFTRRGVSGPVILNMSGDIAEHAGKGMVRLEIDFKPAFHEKELDEELRRAFFDHATMQVKNIFRTHLPSGLIGEFLRYAGVDGEKTGSRVTKEERRLLRRYLLHFPLTVSRVQGFEESMVTRGGVSTREINPGTMESTIVPGLFFAGEVIDVDGRTGGYNLQAAFTTGWCAGNGVR